MFVSLFSSGYILGLIFFGHMDTAKLIDRNSLELFVIFCIAIVPLYTLHKICEWSVENWDKHPIAQNLVAYSNNNTSWMSIASDINTEYRRFIQIPNLYT